MKNEFTEKQAEEFLNEQSLSQNEVDHRLKCTHQPINFHGSVLMNLDLSNRKIKNVNFEGSDLSTSDFSQTKIKNCNFKSVKASLLKRIYLWFKNGK